MGFQAALVQLKPSKAEVSQNLARIAEAIIQAHQAGVDLVCFAESATSGYFLEGGVLECALSLTELGDALAKLVSPALIGPIDACVGFYEMADGQVYNSAAYLTLEPNAWKAVHITRKFFLATYGVFDEDRFIARGREVKAFETRLGPMGILICEDVWHSIMPTLLAVQGAQVILVPSASPARGFSGESISNLERYRRLISALCEEHGVFCLNTQLVGFEAGKGLVGGSMAFDPNGTILGKGPLCEEFMLKVGIDLDLIEVARHANPLLADLQSHWQDLLNHMPQ